MDIVPVGPATKDREEEEECQAKAQQQHASSYAVFHFLKSLNTPVRHFNTFVSLLGGLLSLGKTSPETSKQLTSGEHEEDEDLRSAHSECGPSQAPLGLPPPGPRAKSSSSFPRLGQPNSHGPLLLLPGPEAVHQHNEHRHFHRSSAPEALPPVEESKPLSEADAQLGPHGVPRPKRLGNGSSFSCSSMPELDHDMDTPDAVSANGLPTVRGRPQPYALCWYEHQHADIPHHARDFEPAAPSTAEGVQAQVESIDSQAAEPTTAVNGSHPAVIHQLPTTDSSSAPATVQAAATPAAVPVATTQAAAAHATGPPVQHRHFVPQRMAMGVATEVGQRNSMEDFAFAVPLQAHGHMGPMHRAEHGHHQRHGRFTHAVCFGVFDGHGGAEVAASLAESVPNGLQGGAEHIAQHGPQHVGAILAEQERRLKHGLHRHHHHHPHHRVHTHHNRSLRSHSQAHTSAHAHHHHTKSHSPASRSRSPGRKKEHVVSTPQAAVAMAAAAAAHMQALEMSKGNRASTPARSSRLSTSPRGASSLAGYAHHSTHPPAGHSVSSGFGREGPDGGAPGSGTPANPGSPDLQPHRSSSLETEASSSCCSSATGATSRQRPHTLEVGPDGQPLGGTGGNGSSAAPTPTSPWCEPGPSSLSDTAGCLSDGGVSTMDGAASQYDGRDPGSTALVAAIIDGAMHVANVGDCRLILAELGADGKVGARRITVDHSPMHHPGEAERLKTLGVPVSADGYVGDFGDGGLLQVSRSIGDFKSKMQLSSQVAGEEVILSEPELHTVTLGPGSLFAVAVSDGVTCALSDEDIVSQVCRYLNEPVAPKGAAPGAVRHKNSPQYAAEELVRFAVDSKGSPDNASAVVVSFTVEPPPEQRRPRMFTPRSTNSMTAVQGLNSPAGSTGSMAVAALASAAAALATVTPVQN